jgi:hypothetical protein
MSSASPLPVATNDVQTLGFHPRNRGLVLEEHHQECSPPVLPPLLAKTAAVVGVLKNEDTPNFTPRQNEVTLTKEKGADDRMIPL